jgi:excisionase family DNA binding protein
MESYMLIKYNELLPIIERLDSIQKKLDGRYSNKYLSINEVSELTTLSQSTIRRAVNKGELKCSRKLGKLLFQESDVRRWING